MTAAISFDQVSKRFTIRRQRGRTLRETVLGVFERRRNALPADMLAAREDLWALRDVDLVVEPGDCYGIIGANGSGKSTALKLMTGILEPTSGVVTVRGRVSALLELGAGFHPDLTGRENIFLNGSVLGLNRQAMRRRLDAIVDFSELARFIDMPVKHYSSGMYMRLAFAIAIHVEPDVLLTDEVLAVGDQSFQAKCMERIGQLKQSGMTIVFVSHSLDTVRRICNKGTWLENGRVKAVGTADEVVEAYLASVAEKEEARLATEKKLAEDAGRRWGSGEARITNVRFLDQRGEECHVFRTSGPLTARIYYKAATRIVKPMIGIAIHRDDGVHVNGPNTRFSGFEIPFIEGEGAVDYVMERVPMLAGGYDLSASIYDYDGIHPYDHRHRSYKFSVQPGGVTEQYGLVYAPSHWEHLPGERFMEEAVPEIAAPESVGLAHVTERPKAVG